MFEVVKQRLLEEIQTLRKTPVEKLLDKRLEKFEQMGVTKG
jgi:acetyl-CoA carboxylase alpha subunit